MYIYICIEYGSSLYHSITFSDRPGDRSTKLSRRTTSPLALRYRIVRPGTTRCSAECGTPLPKGWGESRSGAWGFEWPVSTFMYSWHLIACLLHLTTCSSQICLEFETHPISFRRIMWQWQAVPVCCGTLACFQSPCHFCWLIMVSNTADVSSSNSPKVLIGPLHTPVSHQNACTTWRQDMPRPDVVTFNVTMAACEKVTSWLDAVVLLQEVLKQETFGAGGESGRWQKVMLRRGVPFEENFQGQEVSCSRIMIERSRWTNQNSLILFTAKKNIDTI